MIRKMWTSVSNSWTFAFSVCVISPAEATKRRGPDEYAKQNRQIAFVLECVSVVSSLTFSTFPSQPSSHKPSPTNRHSPSLSLSLSHTQTTTNHYPQRPTTTTTWRAPPGRRTHARTHTHTHTQRAQSPLTIKVTLSLQHWTGSQLPTSHHQPSNHQPKWRRRRLAKTEKWLSTVVSQVHLDRKKKKRCRCLAKSRPRRPRRRRKQRKRFPRWRTSTNWRIFWERKLKSLFFVWQI